MARLSKQYMIEQIVSCTKDPEYYLLNFGYVRNPKGGHVRFQLYEYQKECLQAFQDHRFNITLKSRQTGLSTITAGYIAWLMVFFKAKEIAVVANKQDNAQGFIRKVKLIIKKSPSWMVPQMTADNKGSIELANGSRVTAHATTADAARSESLSLLVIDEAAAVDTHKVEDLWAASYPTLSMGGAATVISTPKGVGNWYHKQWLAAAEGTSDFHPLVIHWTQHPVYSVGLEWVCQGGMDDHDDTDVCGHIQKNGDLHNGVACEKCGCHNLKPTSPWYETQKKQLNSDRLVAQELDMDFLGSGEALIDESHIKAMEKNTRPPVVTSGPANSIWTWREPQKDREYLVCADVARGDGSDFSAYHVIDKESREQVCEYKGKVQPDVYARMLVDIGTVYNNAILIVEANSIGYATCLKIVELDYPNIFYSPKGLVNGRDRKKMEQLYKNQDSLIPGFQTTSATRPLVMTQLEEEIRNGSVIIRSVRTISELRTLIWKNGRPEAMYGYNDDLSMALGIGLYVSSSHLQNILSVRESIIASLNNIHGEQTLAEDAVPYTNKAFSRSRGNNNPWVQSTTHGQEDLTWLLGR